MQSDSAIQLDQHGGVATIRFNRPRQRNAFTAGMIVALGELLERLAGDGRCRVVALRGEGGYFCSGWDFDELAAMRAGGDAALRRQFADNLAVLDCLERHAKVTVSLVEGSTMGFGFSLAARCDLVLAADNCRFALPEISLGIVPAIVMADVGRSVPAKFALDWLLTGRDIHPDEALRAAFVSQVFKASEFDESARRLLEQLAKQSPAVLARTKALFKELGGLSAAAAAEAGIEAAIAALNAPAAKEGIAAVLEKREPNWPE